MVVHKVERLHDYLRYLQQNPGEVKALYQDLLINVTSFFRNPDVFETLKTDFFPKLMANRPRDSALRMWAPGCASGEETYSLAIALSEFLGDRSANVVVQLFGTDVSDGNIIKARTGLYPENIQGDVSAERLRRFFSKVEGGYRISKSIRDMCIFAQHNLLNDPPFSQMDLICCRNLLIYLEPVLQKKVIALFHYALRPTGFLALGNSEGVGNSKGLFALEDRNHKIFVKKPASTRPVVTFTMSRSPDRPGLQLPSGAQSKPPETSWNYIEAQKEFDKRLLGQFSPAAVFVNDDLEVIHSRGDIDPYLTLAPGRATLNILKMARDGLLYDLRSALGRAKKEGVLVRKREIELKDGGDSAPREVNIDVVPIRVSNLDEPYYMIVFHEASSHPATASKLKPSKNTTQQLKISTHRNSKLEQELASTREYLHSVVEAQEATTEELQSANEEILSSNEELQSTNEELETAKEELQSANEELSTVNDELRNRNFEITQINNDLTNLLGSVDIPILFLGNDLITRRFTPPVQRVLGLLPTDVGRPFSNINLNLDLPDLDALTLSVMETLVSVEREVHTRSGSPYFLRLVPYRTADNKIDGVVLMLLEGHSSLRRDHEEITWHPYAAGLINGAREYALVLDSKAALISASPGFYEAFRLDPARSEGRPFLQLNEGRWKVPALADLFDSVIGGQAASGQVDLDTEFPLLGPARFRAVLKRIDEESRDGLFILTLQDLSGKIQLESALRDQSFVLDLVTDPLIVRDMSDQIRFWNPGAEELYGFRSDAVVGKAVWDVLKTVFPKSLADANAELRKKQSWEGRVTRTKADGSKIAVVSRWGLIREKGIPVAIVEMSRAIRN